MTTEVCARYQRGATSAAIVDNWPLVTLYALDAREIDAIEQYRQLAGLQLHRHLRRRQLRQLERADLELFVPQGEPCIIMPHLAMY